MKKTLSAAVVAVAIVATPSVADAAVVAVPSTGAASALRSNQVNLSPEEQNATAVVLAPAGQTVTATLRPAACGSIECEIAVTASAPESSVAPVGAAASARAVRARSRVAATSKSTVIALNGARVVEATTSASPSRAASRAIESVPTGDHVCNNISCTLWKIHLGARSYYDGNLAWGTRSRRGYVGSLQADYSAAGGTWSDKKSGYVNDPHATALYANAAGTINAFFNGFPASKSHYIHRHVEASGRTYVVTD